MILNIVAKFSLTNINQHAFNPFPDYAKINYKEHRDE